MAKAAVNPKPKLLVPLICFMGVIQIIFGAVLANYYYSSLMNIIGMNDSPLIHTRLPEYAMPENPRMYFIHIGKAG